ncbi:uncharacterized protein conserved in bacteria [Longilinea arvoryzae]|uniref:Uncharacterized protein conserved in bacteria n=1 Tax=Longilinea arvoryzae TaxID=360412 RepID=A0A0S7BHW4_9CHLR|nr:GyrI-like domain-containing protein [Longilinea arvoryzae]GAP13381.1 uncharacterized protein conserved in bacteria [Longilinea arvoryzae]
MVKYRIVDRPAFEVVGWKTWITGPDNQQFGRFWEKCREDGLFKKFAELGRQRPGLQTRGTPLGISCVDEDPTKRNFYYMIAIEKPAQEIPTGLEVRGVPAAQWAVFECHGKVPESIVEAEMFAFQEWLPASGYIHAHAPEMEVYFPGNDGQSENSYCEFWLPVEPVQG